MTWKQYLLAGAASLTFCAGGMPQAHGQSPVPLTTPQLPQTTEDALRTLTDAAGVVFTGTVTAVRRPAASAGVVEIDFAVADPIKGLNGPAYTLRQWAGLWEASDEPFRPGQRYLMLLHTPNSAGLSSPVGGPDGAIPIRPSAPDATSGTPATQNTATTYEAALAALQSAGEATVDLGWIATRVPVPVTYRAATPARPILSGMQTRVAESPNSAATPVTAPDRLRTRPYKSVVNMLRKWGTPDAL